MYGVWVFLHHDSTDYGGYHVTGCSGGKNIRSSLDTRIDVGIEILEERADRKKYIHDVDVNISRLEILNKRCKGFQTYNVWTTRHC